MKWMQRIAHNIFTRAPNMVHEFHQGRLCSYCKENVQLNTFYKQGYMYILNISALHMAWKCFAINLNLLSKQLIKGFIAQNITQPIVNLSLIHKCCRSYIIGPLHENRHTEISDQSPVGLQKLISKINPDLPQFRKCWWAYGTTRMNWGNLVSIKQAVNATI